MSTANRNPRKGSQQATSVIKFSRFLANVRFMGDVGKAAAKCRVSRHQLDQWMNNTVSAARINEAFNTAIIEQKSEQDAEGVLFERRILPELEKDAAFFRATGQRRESKVIAKLAAANLKGWRWQIIQAANNGDKHFFIDLGNVLSGKIKGEIYDKLDSDVADIYTKNPSISTRKALIELEKRGHTHMEEQTVRTRKSRLGLSKSRVCNS